MPYCLLKPSGTSNRAIVEAICSTSRGFSVVLFSANCTSLPIDQAPVPSRTAEVQAQSTSKEPMTIRMVLVVLSMIISFLFTPIIELCNKKLPHRRGSFHCPDGQCTQTHTMSGSWGCDFTGLPLPQR